MTTAIKRRRGTTSEHSTFTGLAGEITIDTTKDTVVVHDGSTAGGFPLAKENNPTFTGTATFTGDVSFGDNDKAIFGAGSDLQIYHNGSNSVIKDGGVGNLYVQGTNLFLTDSAGYNFVGMVDNGNGGTVTLYHNNSAKLTTISTGIDVAGTILADGLTVGGTGRVGIGTTSPSSFQSYANNLVVGTGDGGEGITVYSGYLDYGALVFADGNGSNSQLRPGQVVYDHGTNSMFFDTNGSERIRIDSAGLVGIGTSLPAAQLDISSATTSTLRLSNTETVLTENQITGQLEFYQADVSASSSGTGITGKIRMRSVPNLNSNYYGLAADMDFNVSGEAQGYASDNATLTAMTIQAGSGNVGIGVISPSSLIHGSGLNAELRLQHTGNSYYQRIFTDSSNNLKFGTGANGTERMRIDSSGNVGIGTSSPVSIGGHTGVLTLYGSNATGLVLKDAVGQKDIRLDNGDLKITDSGGSPHLAVTSAGLVGIGTSSPAAKIDSQEAYDTVSNILTNGTYAAKFGGNTAVGAAGRAQGIMISGRSGNTRGAAIIAENQGSGNGHDLLFATSADASVPAERLRITDAGLVGIGTSLPSEVLQLNSATNAQIRMQPSATGTSGIINTTAGSTKGMVQYNHSSNYMRIYTNGAERMRIDSSGRLQVGTTSAINGGVISALGSGSQAITAKVTNNANSLFQGFNSSGTAVIQALGSGDFYATRIIGTKDGSASAILDRLTSDGEIIQFRKDGTTVGSIGSYSGTGLTLASGGELRFFTSTSNEDMRLETDGDLHVDGNVVAYSTTVSDIRLKKDVAPIENAVTKVQQLNGCTFTYLKDDRKSAGLIAQDVEKVLPSAVIEDEAVFHGEEGETYKTVQYDQVIGLLVEAVKELKAEIEELKDASSK